MSAVKSAVSSWSDASESLYIPAWVIGTYIDPTITPMPVTDFGARMILALLA